MRIDRKLLFIMLFAACLLGQSVVAWAAGNARQDQKCAPLNEQEGRGILDNLRLKEAKLLKIRPSPIQGLWEMAVENRGDRFVIYVDCSKKFVMPGPIIEYQIGVDRTRQRIAELNRDRRVDFAGLKLEESLVMGNRNGPIKAIVFLDPD